MSQEIQMAGLGSTRIMQILPEHSAHNLGMWEEREQDGYNRSQMSGMMEWGSRQTLGTFWRGNRISVTPQDRVSMLFPVTCYASVHSQVLSRKVTS